MSSVLRPVSEVQEGRRTLGPVEISPPRGLRGSGVGCQAVELIRSLVPLGLMHVRGIARRASVTALAGARYARKPPRRSAERRHGSNPGTVGLAGLQRVTRIRVPRIRHVAGSEIPLRSYRGVAPSAITRSTTLLLDARAVRDLGAATIKPPPRRFSGRHRAVGVDASSRGSH